MNPAGHVIGFELRQRTFGAFALMLAVSLSCFGLVVSGVAATNVITTYGVRTWQTDDGLPQNSVYSIAQTGDGYIWVGTGDGLARFDGVRFTVLDEKAPPELQHGSITALCADRDGSLWIGCDGYGVAHWKEGKLDRKSTRLNSSHLGISYAVF